MMKKLELLYGREATNLEIRIQQLIETYRHRMKTDRPPRKLSEKDSILITYADSIRHGDEKSFKTLNRFLENHVKKAFSGVHILPFYPYSSDDGFSVVDYCQVKEDFGDWADLDLMGETYDLMFDAVINHISQFSAWYEGFKAGDPTYKDFFILCDPALDYSEVVRPRALPLLTPVTVEGKDAYVWTTFSDDQIDLNYGNPEVFFKILEVLFEYVSHGAKLIRLDAIGFAWKELGTTCIHLPQTHLLIQLMREALIQLKEDIVIITETNVPHKENISYFGNGHNEAHMVYQFPLPPLTLHALLTGDGHYLTAWAQSLEGLSDETTFFNFLASHDGVGLRPVEGMLDSGQVQVMVDAALRNGGRINYKNNSDGTKSPYEMNINYMDALRLDEDDDQKHQKRFLAAQAILLSMIGVPGVYIHSLLGSGNDIPGMELSGINRRINREKLEDERLTKELGQEGRRRSIYRQMLKMLEVRAKESAFNPFGRQKVLTLDQGVFAVERYSIDGRSKVLVLINLQGDDIRLNEEVKGRDLITNETYDTNKMVLKAYQVLWIK